MRIVVAKLESVSPYSQSRHYDVPKLPKELHKDYEARTWRNRCNADKDGNIFIPPQAFKGCVETAARYLSMQIPGKGKATYSKHFKSGILVAEGMTLPVTQEKVAGEWHFVPSDGRKGGGSRVMKCFPIIPQWSGEVTYYILDDIITPDVFEKHLKEAGNFIGVGRFRCENGGYYGRFKIISLKWQQEQSEDAA